MPSKSASSRSKGTEEGKKNNRTNSPVGGAFDFLRDIKRDPKKRKIKTVDTSNFHSSHRFEDTSSDDSDYKPKEENEDDDIDDSGEDTAGNVQESEDEDDEQEDEGEGEEDSPEDSQDAVDLDVDKKVAVSLVREFEMSKARKLLVCTVCCGDVSHENDEIVECDACGVSVHEACYGIVADENDVDSVHSKASSDPTEPWFCDGCKASNPSPVCDLCPNSGGIYKQTDVGRWVHLVCSLYIPGVAFADTIRLAGVTLFELNYDRWGAKTCSLCEDERLARTGICISCDAGMCKTYFHVTCAQREGLLQEVQNSTDETEVVSRQCPHSFQLM